MAPVDTGAVVSEQIRQVDVVVLGLGPGGGQLARELAEAGLEVAGVDMHLVGGECPFYGCTPSKLMVRAAETLAEARHVAALAGSVDVRPDWGKVATRIREVTDDWHDADQVADLESSGVTVVRGRGRLAGPGRVEVADGPTLVASRGVVLATGTSPARLPIEGLADTPYLSNREVMRLEELPERFVIVGGGPNGVELAQAFARFGSHVTLLESEDTILGAEEPEAARVITTVLAREGVDVRTGVDISHVSHDGSFRLTVDGATLDADQLLVAAGRHLEIDDIGLETVDLDPTAESVHTDERMRAGERLWALGDITGKGAFTHVAHYQATIVRRDILGEDGPWADYHAVSRVTFTDPEVGSVGMTEHEARDAGLRVAIGTADMAESPRGWIHGPGNDGLVKLVADTDAGVLVGACVVGPYAGEVLGMLVAAVHARTPAAMLREMHFAFPTLHASIQAALSSLPG